MQVQEVNNPKWKNPSTILSAAKDTYGNSTQVNSKVKSMPTV